MNILVAEPDTDLNRILELMLTQAGHEVRLAQDARAAFAMHSSRPAEVLLIDSRLSDSPGIELIRQIRKRESVGTSGARQQVHVLFLADDASSAARREVEELGGVRVLGKPPSLLDLLDILQGFAAAAPTAPRPAPPAALSLPNVRLLAKWWARRATGVVRTDLDGGTSLWVLLSAGGPVGVEGLQALLASLGGGRIELDTCEVDSTGDNEAFGRELWRAVRAWVADSERPSSTLTIAPTVDTPRLQDLPVSGRIRAALNGLEGPASASAIAERSGLPMTELLADLHALVALGLLRIQAPAVAAPAPARPGGDTSSGDTRPRVPTPLFRALPAPEAPFGAVPRNVADDPTLPRSPILVDRARQEQDPPTAPRATASEIAHQVLRLRRELRVLETADAWTVLGLPRGSAPDVVAHAAERMSSRYQPLTHSPHAELRALGTQMYTRVRGAHTDIQKDGSSTNPTEGQLLGAGRAMLARGNWDAADRRFSAARDISPSSAPALAWLGYARFNNPEFEREFREDEGLAFVDLALAFDPSCIDALYLRASIAAGREDTTTARSLLDRLFTAQPTHPEARSLARKLGERPA